MPVSDEVIPNLRHGGFYGSQENTADSTAKRSGLDGVYVGGEGASNRL